MARCGSLKGQGFWSSPLGSSKVEEKSEGLLFYFPCDFEFRSHYGKGQKSPLYWYILASPSGSQILSMWPCFLVQRAFICGLLMGQFPGGKTNRANESPVSPLPPSPGLQPQGRLMFLFFNQACLAVPRFVPVLFLSHSTKAQLQCHFFWETFLFKTPVGICQHPFPLYAPPSSSSSQHFLLVPTGTSQLQSFS